MTRRVTASSRLRVAGSFRRYPAGSALTLTLVPSSCIFAIFRGADEYRVQVLLSGLDPAGACLGIRSEPAGGPGRPVAGAAGADADRFLVLGSHWYPLADVPSKAGGFQGPATLDGLDYIRQNSPGDDAAITGSAPTCPRCGRAGGPGGSYSPEGAERVSMSTGNPTLLGWDFHERQWSGNAASISWTAGRTEPSTGSTAPRARGSAAPAGTVGR